MANAKEVLNSKSFMLTITFKNGVKLTVDKSDLQTKLFNRLKKLRLPNIRNVYVNLSASTESVYGIVTFRNRKSAFVFCIRNHESGINKVSKEYFYSDYNSIDHIINQIKRDIDSAYFKRSFCISTQLNLVEYEVLRALSETDYNLVVETNENESISNFWFEKDGVRNDDYNVKFLNKDMLKYLFRRKMLMEPSNCRKLKGLSISKLGYLSLAKGRHLYDSSVKFDKVNTSLA